MDNAKLNSQLQELNKIKITNLRNANCDICIYWFRAVSHTLKQYTITSRMHHHTFFELHFIMNGKVTYRIEDYDIIVGENESILIAPMQMHKITSASDNFIKLSIAFSIPKNNILYTSLYDKNIIVSKISEEVINNINFILKEAEKKSYFSDILIKNRIFEILCFVAGNIKTQKTEEENKNEIDERIIRAKKYIADNMNIFLSCSDVAQYCYLSPKQLGRIFKKYENTSLLKYIHDSKIREAEKLLSQNEKTLKDISTDLGFANEYYFNRFFTSHTGMTPGDYRKAQPNNNNEKNQKNQVKRGENKI